MNATAHAGQRARRGVTPEPLVVPGANEPRDGVLVLNGYGLRIAVERGHLVVGDGLGDERRWGRFNRLDRTLKRVVIIGHTGSVSLEAIRWLHGVGIPLVHLNPDGTVYFVAAPSAAMVPALRRGQAMAAETGFGTRLSQQLVMAKVGAQRRLLARLPGSEEARETLQSLLQAIESATGLRELRKLEGIAARAYWSAWQGLPVRFADRDRELVPHHWLRFTSRASALTKSTSPRKAVSPVNAALNYLYAVLEAEARIACLAVGLDPMLGLLHTDKQCRDSLALDVMEPVRPTVDGYVLDLLASYTFTRRDVHELEDGQCRLLSPLTEVLAQTSGRWAGRVLEVAQMVARTFMEAEPGATLRRGPVGTVRRFERTPHMRAPRLQRVVVKEYRREPDLEEDRRRGAEAGRKRRETMQRVRAANLEWEARHPGPYDVHHYRTAVLPSLKRIKIRALMAATGLGNPACVIIRQGRVVPHPRHWRALAGLVARSDGMARGRHG